MTNRVFLSSGNVITMKNNQSKIESRIECSNLPWYGKFPVALKAFHLSPRKDFRFLVLDEDKFSTVEMEAIYLGMGNGLEKVKVTIPGPASLLWSIIFYLDSTGSELKYVGTDEPSTPEVVQTYTRK